MAKMNEVHADTFNSSRRCRDWARDAAMKRFIPVVFGFSFVTPDRRSAVSAAISGPQGVPHGLLAATLRGWRRPSPPLPSGSVRAARQWLDGFPAADARSS